MSASTDDKVIYREEKSVCSYPSSHNIELALVRDYKLQDSLKQ